MPTKDDPRVVLRIAEADHRVLKAAAALDGNKLGTWIRDTAVKAARIRTGERVPAATEATVPAPPAAPSSPVTPEPPPAASQMPYGCPSPGCTTRARAVTAVCPVHGRRVQAVR